MNTNRLRLDDFIPYRLSIATNVVSELISTAYDRLFGLSTPEWRVIAVLAEAKELSQQDVAAKTRMDKVTVSRAANTLQARGLVARIASPRDGRARMLHLTPSGRSLYNDVVPTALALEADILAELDRSEIAALVATLGKLETAAIRIRLTRESDGG